MPVRWKKALMLCALVGAAVLLCRYPQAAATGASRGLTICGTVIIPSILPFLVLIGTFLRCSAAGALGRRLAKPTAYLLRLPSVCAAPILLSFVGGYPAGAAAVRDLLDAGRISTDEARRMLHFCVNAGPAFAVGTVGGMLLQDPRIGWMLWAAQLVSAWTIGIAEARTAPKIQVEKAPRTRALPLSAAFAQAVNTAVTSTLSMCGFVILFAVVLGIADGCGLMHLLEGIRWADVPVSTLVSGIAEVTAGCIEAAGHTPPLLFWIGFFVGFGGVSVHCQIHGLLAEHNGIWRHFLLARIVHGLLGGGWTVVLYRIIPRAVQTWQPNGVKLHAENGSPFISLVMLAMCAVCMLADGAKGAGFTLKKRLPK